MKRSLSWIAVLPSLVIPVSVGLSLYLGLTVLIDQGHLSNPLLVRYVTGHPISQVTVAMFFIGLASLAGIGKNLIEQFLGEQRIQLTARYSEGETEPEAAESPAAAALECGQDLEAEVARQAACLQRSLDALPQATHTHYLWQRLHGALAHVQRTRSTGTVDEELKYLGDLDLDRQQQRYALVRILIWATPMLGFLGTVLGISDALGGINVGPENDFQDMMNGLRGSLYVAFDTTALALTLSMVLMFVQFLVDRFESQLLSLVDQRARHEIALHLDLSESRPELRELADRILSASEQGLRAQVETWRKSLRAAEQAWSSSLTEANAQVQSNLSEALQTNLARLADQLESAIERADSAMGHRWQQWQVTLSENARSMTDVQKLLSGQLQLIQELSEDTEQEQRWQTLLTTNQEAVAATAALRVALEQVAEHLAAPVPPEPAPATPESTAAVEPSSPLPEEAAVSPTTLAGPWTSLTPEEVFAIETLPAAEPRANSGPAVAWRAPEVSALQGQQPPTTSTPEAIRYQPHSPSEPVAEPGPAAGQEAPEIILKFPGPDPLDTTQVDQASQRAETFLSLRRQRRAA